MRIKDSILNQMWTFSVGCLLFGAAIASAAPPAVSFHGEKIVVTVLGDRIRVCGDYHFRNRAAVNAGQRLYYPFPVDSLHPSPDTVFIESEGVEIPFQGGDRGVSFTASVPAASMATYRICYEQRCAISEGCYILTTTSAWPEPLAEAEFEVILPAPYRLVELSYEAERSEREDGAAVYRFRRKDFLPDRDLCVRWRVPTE